MKIAVIGAGISGLTVAYRLGRRHDVVLFEANDYLGGHANTVDVEIDGERHAIDTGFVVFNNRTYPNFVAMLDELGVRSRPTEMSFSVRCDRTGLEYNGSSVSGLFAQRLNALRPRFLRMLADIVRFNRQVVSESTPGIGGKEATVAEFLENGRYSVEFSEHYLIPMGSAIWSSPAGVFEQFPIRFVLEFFRNHGLLELRGRPQWRVVEGGARTYVAALVGKFRGAVCMGTQIARVQRRADCVLVTPAGGRGISFDHVVFACHSDQALRILDDPSPVERVLLSAFPYQVNLALLHTETSMLPRNRRAWASWNYRVPREELPYATVTYCLNILQQIRSRHVFNVTLNPLEPIDSTKVLARFVYEHPVFTTGRSAAQARHHEVINVNRSSFCGAYWRNGFHEDGVVSALAICRVLDAIDEKQEQYACAQAHSDGVA